MKTSILTYSTDGKTNHEKVIKHILEITTITLEEINGEFIATAICPGHSLHLTTFSNRDYAAVAELFALLKKRTLEYMKGVSEK